MKRFDPEDPFELLSQLEKEFAPVLKKFGASFPAEGNRYAILDENGEVIPATLLEWAMAQEHSRQRFLLSDKFFGYKVSTVFLGLNHRFGEGPPLWFETMIFDRWKGEYSLIDDRPITHCDIYLDRYTTKAQAIEGHARAIAWLQIQPFYYQLALPYER